MIEIEDGYSLPVGGNCDYCFQGLDPGSYLALFGYRVLTDIPEDRKPHHWFPSVLVLEPPFIPCTKCLIELGISEDTVFIDADKVQDLHTKVAEMFHKVYAPDKEILPSPRIELL